MGRRRREIDWLPVALWAAVLIGLCSFGLQIQRWYVTSEAGIRKDYHMTVCQHGHMHRCYVQQGGE